MPEISLRAYGREIDELIERERLEEAIAHCRFILQTYPKHLETYRLLGKAYLEAKRYGDAADIFQRVLSAVPDDFVSHVGMAIVREDEGNLDAAIWHMERAFETNPSNPAIQQEMKRLISRRDGLEPHKVRLTRGALARMYAHGELFAQAIAELRSALQEDPERPDLQVLLASMYWQIDQRSDATSVSNQILEKLPYCAEANRILAANLQAGDRVEEAAVYHRRLASLDPYAAFVESALVDANSIEETAVSLEKLDWVAGEPLPSAAPGQPGWAATLGMEMQEPAGEIPEEAGPPQTGPLPSWLEPGEPPPFEAAAEKELREEMESDAVGAPADEGGAGFLEDLEPESLEEEVPEPVEAGFLEDLEPESLEEEVPELVEEEGEGAGLGVAAAAAGIAAGILAGEEEDEALEPEAEEFLEPELEEDAEVDAAAAGIAAAAIADGDDEETEIPESPEAVLPPEEEAETAFAVAPTEEALAEEAALAGGMFDEVEEAEAPEDELEPLGVEATDTELEPGEESGIPEWMQEAGWTESSGEFEDAPVSFSDQELDSLDAGQIPAEVPVDEDAELAPAELPEWIHDIAPDEVEGSSDGVGEDGMPSWIGREEDVDVEDTPDLEPVADEADEGEFPAADADTSEIPTWITEDQPGATETIVTWLEDRGPDAPEEEPTEEETVDLPDWMRDTGPLEESLDPGIVEMPDEEAAAPEPQAEGAVEDTETPAAEGWLSAVAAVAAEDEEAEPETPETPDWLSEAMETPEVDEGVGAGLGLAAAAAVGMVAGEEGDEDQEEDLVEMDDEIAPSAVEGEIEEPALEEEAEAPTVEEEVDLFAEAEEEVGLFEEAEAPTVEEQVDLSAEVEAHAVEEEVDLFAEEAVSDVEMEDLAPEAVEDIPAAEPAATPDWLQEIGTLPQQPVGTDSADWLDGLEVDGEEVPAEPAAETPDWLKGLAEEGADAEESAAAPAADWLREIGEPGSVDEEIEEAEPPIEEAELELEEELVEQPEAAGAPDWLQRVQADEAEEAFEELPEVEEPEAVAPAGEDDEVMDWLEDLAAKQAEAPDESELEAAAQVAPTAPVLEDRDIPDEPDEGLEWLEQLADQRGIDVDVGVPGQAAAPAEPEPPLEPEMEPEPEPSADDTAPGWLGRMATQPIPKVDLEALEAAARGEEVSPDAETVEAQAAEVKAQLEAAEPQEVAPDDITIEERASDLKAEMEAEQAIPEKIEAEEEIEAEDEIPDWLIAAAEQAEAPVEVPTSMPEEFEGEVVADEPAPIFDEAVPKSAEEILDEPVDLEPETAPALEEGIQEIEAEAPEISAEPIDLEPEAVSAYPEFEEPVTEEPEALAEDVEPEAAPAYTELEEPVVEAPEVRAEELEPEAAPAYQEVEEVISDVEEEAVDIPAEPEEIEFVEDVEPAIEEPEPVEEVVAPVAEPDPEIKKREDLLESSRQALASGDIQTAVEMYGDMVKRRESLDSVIEDLRMAVDRTPDDADLWQVLGDAYMRDDQTDEAIDAYRKGMEAA